jgi:hypothetical protein
MSIKSETANNFAPECHFLGVGCRFGVLKNLSLAKSELSEVLTLSFSDPDLDARLKQKLIGGKREPILV